MHEPKVCVGVGYVPSLPVALIYFHNGPKTWIPYPITSISQYIKVIESTERMKSLLCIILQSHVLTSFFWNSMVKMQTKYIGKDRQRLIWRAQLLDESVDLFRDDL